MGSLISIHCKKNINIELQNITKWLVQLSGILINKYQPKQNYAFNICSKPALFYGSDTWVINKISLDAQKLEEILKTTSGI